MGCSILRRRRLEAISFVDGQFVLIPPGCPGRLFEMPISGVGCGNYSLHRQHQYSWPWFSLFQVFRTSWLTHIHALSLDLTVGGATDV